MKLSHNDLIWSLVAYIYCMVYSTGSYHAMALDEFGNVYSWGENRNGQLGNGSCMPEAEPSLIKKISHPDKKFKFVACGTNHSFMINHSGILFAMGWYDSFEYVSHIYIIFNSLCMLFIPKLVFLKIYTRTRCSSSLPLTHFI